MHKINRNLIPVIKNSTYTIPEEKDIDKVYKTSAGNKTGKIITLTGKSIKHIYTIGEYQPIQRDILNKETDIIFFELESLDTSITCIYDETQLKNPINPTNLKEDTPIEVEIIPIIQDSETIAHLVTNIAQTQPNKQLFFKLDLIERTMLNLESQLKFNDLFTVNDIDEYKSNNPVKYDQHNEKKIASVVYSNELLEDTIDFLETQLSILRENHITE